MPSLRINQDALPLEERAAADSIEENFASLESNASEFRQSVDLYLFSYAQGRAVQDTNHDQYRELSGWVKIAGRNGAIVAYSYAKVLEAINSTKAPTIWAKADLLERGKATKLFSREFPTINGIRQSAAHPGELRKNETEIMRHRLYESGRNLYFENIMQVSEDRMIFESSFLGKLVHYELSKQKADILDAVLRHYNKAFSPLELDSDTLHREWLEEGDEKRLEAICSPWWSGMVQT